MKKNFFVTLLVIGIICIGGFTNVQAKTLTIASEEFWPPYCLKDKHNGESVGFASEVVKNVLKNMGVEYKIKPYPWKRAEKFALDGKVDALFPASLKTKRAEKCYYPAVPLFDSEYFFYINKKNKGKLKYDDLSDLKGHKIGVSAGYSYTTEFIEFIKENKNSDEAKTDELNLKKLAYGRFDYFPGEAGSVALLVKSLGIANKIVRLPKPFIQKPYYIIFNKGKVDEAFVNKFSDALKAFKTTDEFKSIYTSYFGS